MSLSIISTLIAHFLQIFMIKLLFNVEWINAAKIYALGFFVAFFSPVPGGIGVYETAMALILGIKLGITNALNRIIIYRLFSFYFWILFGLFLTYLLY